MNRIKYKPSRNGFTLTELIIAVTGVVIVPAVTLTLIGMGVYGLVEANTAKIEINKKCNTDYNVFDVMTSYDTIKDCGAKR